MKTSRMGNVVPWNAAEHGSAILMAQSLESELTSLWFTLPVRDCDTALTDKKWGLELLIANTERMLTVCQALF